MSNLPDRKRILITIAATVCIMCTNQPELARMLPDQVEGWSVAEQDRIYTPENLYDYINGGAELYLSYNFQQMINRVYSAPDQPQIQLDLFDMGISQNAYGVFSHSRETIDSTFGQGSQYTPGLLLFWKDRYYISILASPETEQAKQAIFRISRHIEQAIPREGQKPRILRLLPEESLVPESVRYFHHYIWLNSHYYIADENILHINEETDAILARYGMPDQRYYLLLIQYPGDDEAVQARDDFVRGYAPELQGKRIVRIEDGTYLGCQVIGRHLIAVLNGTSDDAVQSLMERVSLKITEERTS